MEMPRFLSGTVRAAFATAILALITFAAVTPGPLDDSLKSAVRGFAWSSSLLGGHLALSASNDCESKPLRWFLRLALAWVWIIAGFVCWFSAASSVLVHLGLSKREVNTIVMVFVSTFLFASSLGFSGEDG